MICRGWYNYLTMKESVLSVNRTYPFWDIKDQQVNVHDWFLMQSPFPVAALMVSYWLIVLRLGPLYMKSREPFNVTKYLVAYNIIQIAISLHIFRTGLNYLLTYGLFPSISCPGDPIESRVTLTTGFHMYMLAKITELLDTVFFVLKKNYRQITFLHVYHHSINVILTWIAIKINSINPSAAFLGSLNGFVHVIMYTYYGLSAFPSMTKYLWWKKYITTLQLAQFFMIMIHYFVSYKIARCEELNIIFLAIIFHLFLFVYLFLDFYIKTYLKRKDK